ncbi:hypothetical protein [Acanthopleuribacter pedis]|uniref:Lipoprotein n=1 Tax=Acanthopleuribacter pedis TaxID=442870 RepID=A0A8J7QAZ2_9BACT|nr:hypothetical protein [Acanthopleuribacter pedis]MBO1320820.1 hypothetical protein [Acanthopleuribacter pedis]
MFQNVLKKVLIAGFALLMGSYAFAACRPSFVLVQDNWCADGSAVFYTSPVSGAIRYNWKFTMNGKTVTYTGKSTRADIAAESFGFGGGSYKLTITTYCGDGTSGSTTKYGTLGGNCFRKAAVDTDLAGAQNIAAADFLTQLNHASQGKTHFLTGEQGAKLLVNDSDQVQNYVLVEKWGEGEMIANEISLGPGDSYAFDVHDQEMFVFGDGDVIAQDK